MVRLKLKNNMPQPSWFRSKVLDPVFQMMGLQLDEEEEKNLLLLLLLYTLQGVPMGLSSSISFLLQERGATYSEQGTFSLSSWPYSLKFLWAPLVDAIYFSRFGQRKSWLFPLQIVVGLLLLGTSANIGTLLGDGAEGEEGRPSVTPLTVLFFGAYFLLASQDIAVDGWAITLLSPKNVGLASTVNAVGLTLGVFISFNVFLVLNSWGWVSIQAFISFWGVVFISSALVVFAKQEKKLPEEDQLSISEAYKQAVTVLRIPSIRPLAALLLTRYAAFSAAESLIQLKLIEKGMPKQHMAVVSAVMTPLQLVMPVAIAKWTAGPRPLDAMLGAYPLRCVGSALAAAVVWGAPRELGGAGAAVPWAYYGAVTVWSALYLGSATVQFVATMSYFSQISDPVIGGTYMTLLNTINNLGSKWCNSLVLFVYDAVAAKPCVAPQDHSTVLGQCGTDALTHACTANLGGKCITTDSSFHVMVIASGVLGLLWLLFAHPISNKLQSKKISEWHVVMHSADVLSAARRD